MNLSQIKHKVFIIAIIMKRAIVLALIQLIPHFHVYKKKKNEIIKKKNNFKVSYFYNIYLFS